MAAFSCSRWPSASPAGTAARLASALDTGNVALERDGFALSLPARVGLVALDEGRGEDEKLPAALIERCGYVVDLNAVGARDIEPGPFDACGCGRRARAFADRLGGRLGHRSPGRRRRRTRGRVAPGAAVCAARSAGGLQRLTGAPAVEDCDVATRCEPRSRAPGDARSRVGRIQWRRGRTAASERARSRATRP